MENIDVNRELVEIKKEFYRLKQIMNNDGQHVVEKEISALEKRVKNIENDDCFEALALVKLSRNQKRPTTKLLCDLLLDDFIELHGDRLFADDPSIVGGIGFLDDKPVTVIGHQKGRNVHENVYRNFGMAHPEGYRKALRLMKEAEIFGRPVITFIDTPGAYPGIEAEKRGQSRAIAQNLYELSGLKTPSVSIVIGEGGSGGALALGITDRIFMFSNAIYSVISPEGCASILWKDAGQAAKAAKHLNLSAKDQLRFKIIDEIIEEPDFEHLEDYSEFAQSLKEMLNRELDDLSEKSLEVLLSERYDKFRNIGLEFYPDFQRQGYDMK